MEEGQIITEQSDEIASQEIPPPFSEVVQKESTSNEGVHPISLLFLEEIARSVPTLLSEVQELRQDFESKVKYDESKERIIDTLHAELQSYREGLHFKILQPVFKDLINIYDDFARLIEVLQEKEEGVGKQEIQNLKTFQEAVEEVLYRNGVEVLRLEDATYVGGKQRILRVVETADPALDKQIVRRVRKGFSYEERILRHEIIEIYKYAAPQNEEREKN